MTRCRRGLQTWVNRSLPRKRKTLGRRFRQGCLQMKASKKYHHREILSLLRNSNILDRWFLQCYPQTKASRARKYRRRERFRLKRQVPIRCKLPKVSQRKSVKKISLARVTLLQIYWITIASYLCPNSTILLTSVAKIVLQSVHLLKRNSSVLKTLLSTT